MFQRAELAIRLKPKLAQEGKERMSKGGKNKGKDKLPYLGVVREQIGEIAGVSGKTVDRVETILNKGTPEDITEVGEGERVDLKDKDIVEKLPQSTVRDQLGEIAGNNQYSPSRKNDEG